MQNPTKKILLDRFCRFDVYWIQTNKQTDRQAKYIYRKGLKKNDQQYKLMFDFDLTKKYLNPGIATWILFDLNLLLNYRLI